MFSSEIKYAVIVSGRGRAYRWAVMITRQFNTRRNRPHYSGALTCMEKHGQIKVATWFHRYYVGIRIRGRQLRYCPEAFDSFITPRLVIWSDTLAGSRPGRPLQPGTHATLRAPWIVGVVAWQDDNIYGYELKEVPAVESRLLSIPRDLLVMRLPAGNMSWVQGCSTTGLHSYRIPVTIEFFLLDRSHPPTFLVPEFACRQSSDGMSKIVPNIVGLGFADILGTAPLVPNREGGV